MIDVILNFLRNESGAPSVEYALLLAFIALAVIASVETLGNAVSGAFQSASDRLSGSGGS
jgi:Flp pilus assembly pilin Flp